MSLNRSRIHSTRTQLFKRMKKHILLLICFLQCAINYGTDFNVTATPNIVRLGEPIILTIQGPNLTQLQLPDLTPFQITSDSQGIDST